ncbi:uncharacterized protein [Vicugna pacos]|uniref:Uncharacterized protein n=1 Tax=Vicugna pacos TaxID=30538 RepID=A0ABM5BKN5_VICPA
MSLFDKNSSPSSDSIGYGFKTGELGTQSRAEGRLSRPGQKTPMPDQPRLSNRTKGPRPTSTTVLINCLQLIHWAASSSLPQQPLLGTPGFFVPCTPPGGWVGQPLMLLVLQHTQAWQRVENPPHLGTDPSGNTAGPSPGGGSAPVHAALTPSAHGGPCPHHSLHPGAVAPLQPVPRSGPPQTGQHPTQPCSPHVAILQPKQAETHLWQQQAPSDQLRSPLLHPQPQPSGATGSGSLLDELLSDASLLEKAKPYLSDGTRKTDFGRPWENTLVMTNSRPSWTCCQAHQGLRKAFGRAQFRPLSLGCRATAENKGRGTSHTPRARQQGQGAQTAVATAWPPSALPCSPGTLRTHRH